MRSPAAGRRRRQADASERLPRSLSLLTICLASILVSALSSGPVSPLARLRSFAFPGSFVCCAVLSSLNRPSVAVPHSDMLPPRGRRRCEAGEGAGAWAWRWRRIFILGSSMSKRASAVKDWMVIKKAMSRTANLRAPIFDAVGRGAGCSVEQNKTLADQAEPTRQYRPARP